MRKQIPTARGFITQRIAQRVGIDCDQQQIVLSGKMPCCRFKNLLGGRKVEVPILDIDGSSVKRSGVFSLTPQKSGANFVNNAHEIQVAVRRFWSNPY